MPPPAPPSPSRPPVAEDPSPYIADPEALKTGVINDLEMVEEVWKLRSDSSGSSTIPLPLEPGSSQSISEFDVLHVLKVTTRAIRSVRNYLLALPDDHPTLHFGSNLIEAFRRHSISRPGFSGRRMASGVTTPRPSGISTSISHSNTPSQLPVAGPAPPDPPSVIRRAALDVLSALRALEERCRIPLSDEAYNAESGRFRAESPVSFALDKDTNLGRSFDSADEGIEVTDSSTPLSGSSPQPPIPRSPKPEIVPLKVQGREKTVQVWADPEEDLWDDFDDDAAEKQDPWDERIVLGGGWLYRHDVALSSLGKEQNVIRRYLDVVDEVVFANSIPATPGQRGWQRAKLDSVSRIRTAKSPRPSLGASDGSPRRSSGGSPSSRKRLISTTLLDAMSEVSMLTNEPRALGSSSLRIVGEDYDRDHGHDYEEQENDIADDSLPDWAKRSLFKDNPTNRLHALIAAHLPPELLAFLPYPRSLDQTSDPFTASISQSAEDSAAFRDRLLTVLSDGQILCTAYNLVVRKSRNPWGYIQLENVHDLLGLTHEPEKEQAELDLSLGSSQRGNAKTKSSWTFRRTENLKYWAA